MMTFRVETTRRFGNSQISKTLAAGDFELHQAPDVQQHLVAIIRNFLLKADTLTQPR